MSEIKISELPELTQIGDNDTLIVNDASDGRKTKKIKKKNLISGIPQNITDDSANSVVSQDLFVNGGLSVNNGVTAGNLEVTGDVTFGRLTDRDNNVSAVGIVDNLSDFLSQDDVLVTSGTVRGYIDQNLSTTGITTLNEKVEDLENAINSGTSTSSTLTDRFNLDSDRMDAMTVTVANVSSDLTALTTRVSVNESGISVLNTQVSQLNSSLASNIDNVDSDVANVAGRVSQNETDITTLQTDLGTETSARSTADTQLATDIGAETTRATTAEAALAQDIADEANARALAIGQLTSSTDSDVLQEQTERAAEDTNLQNQINAEVSRATGEEARIEAKLDNVISNTDSAALDSLTEIVNAFQTADGDINALVGSNTTAITNEATARSNADTTLQNNIDSETAARISGDASTLSSAQADATNKANTAEANAIAHADAQDAALIGDNTVDGTYGNTISDRISAAQTAAQNYTNQQGSAETAARDSDVADLLSRLQDETTRSSNAESGLQSDIDQNTADVSALDSDLAAEIVRATNAEQGNATSIAQETLRALGVEGGLRTDVDALETQIDNLLGTSPGTLDTLQEIVAAFEDADSDIQELITANSGRLTTAEGNITTLQTEMNAVELRASSLEGRATALETDVSANETDISDLDTRVGTNETDISNLETRVGTNESAIVTINNSIGSNATSIGNVSTQVSDLASSAQVMRASNALTVSNDTITIHKGDGTSESVTISDAYDPDDQTLSWNGSTGELSISGGNTVDLDGRYQTAGSYQAAGSYVTTTSAQALHPTDALQVSNDTITLVRADGTSESHSISDANTNYYINGASFNTGTGVLSLTGVGTSASVDLDGRYQIAGSYQPAGSYDNYVSWTISDGSNTEAVTSGKTMKFAGAGASSVSYDASTNTMTISSTDTNTDTNTTYSTATSSTLGLVKIGYSENGRNYPVELSSGKMFVNVPWTDTNTDTNSVDYINGASFSTSTGVLTLSGVGNAGASVDLDGRYQLAGSYQAAGSYVTTTSKQALHATDALRISGDTISLYKADGTSESVTITDDNTNNYLNGLSFSGGTLTASRQGLGNVTVNLDGRYQLAGSYQAAGSYVTTSSAQALHPTNAIDVSNDTITINKADGTSESVTISDANTNYYINGASFNTGNGILSLTGVGTSASVDLDGRYQLAGSYQAAGSYVTTSSVQALHSTDALRISGDTISLYKADGTYESVTITDDNTNNYLNSASFNTGNGVLTLGRSGLSDVTVDLDGRYQAAGSYQPAGTYDNYSYWKISDGTNSENITSTQTLKIVGSGASSTSYDASSNTLTISSTDTNTDTNTNNYVSSASFSTSNGVLTLNRSGLGAVTVDLDGRYSQTDTNNIDYINGASFSTSTGVLTLSGVGSAGASVDLDGRYQIAGSYDNYSSWTISDGSSSEAIGSGSTLKVVGSGATSTSYNASTNTLTINSTDTNTDTNTNNYLSSASFNTTNGVLTLNRSGLGAVTVDLDGRYSTTDTNTTYSQATSSTLGLVKIGYSENGNNYPVELSNGQMYVNVPWTDTNTDTNTTYSFGFRNDDDGADDVTLRVTAGGSGSGVTDLEFEGNNNITFTSGGSSKISALIANNSVGNAKLADMATGTIKGRVTAGTGNPEDLSAAQVRSLLNVANGANNYSLPLASGTVRGGVKVGYSENGKNYPVELDNEKMYVNVPWTDTNTDTNTTYSAGTGLDLSGTTFSLEPDLRNEVDYIGGSGSTNDYIDMSSAAQFKIIFDGVEDFRFSDGGNFHADGNICAYSTTTTSDERLKENIQVVENPIEKLQQIRGVEFDWKDDGEKSAGVIAQDVEKVLPQAVKEFPALDSKGEGEMIKSVNYDAIQSLLIESIKEQQKQIEELKAEIASLKG